MSDEDFARVDELFNAARDLPPAERDAFLRETCGDDEALCARIAALLWHAGGLGNRNRR